jgi:Ca-activated chloride channel family protein
MKGALAGSTLVLFVVALGTGLRAQTPTSETARTAGPVPSSSPAVEVVQVSAGEGLVLELQDSLDTRTTRKGDHAHFITTSEVLAGGRVVVPRGTTVRATVTEAKRPGRLFGRAQIKLNFDQIIMPDGTSLPLAASLRRAGLEQPADKLQQTVKGERGKSADVSVVAQGAATGAVIGGIAGRGAKDMGKGAAVGAGVAALLVLLQRGPELDLPPGMRFEVELTQPLNVPLKALEPPPVVASDSNSIFRPMSEEGPGSTPTQTVRTDQPVPPPVFSPPPATESQTSSTPVASQTPSPPPVQASVGPPEPGTFTLKVDVSLVLVEATVRDEAGKIVEGLKQEDFRVFEDGVEQQLQYFSRDQLPLAVALVVDRSGSIAPVLSELHRTAYATLSQLKPEDQVALYAFAAHPERLELLTDDRQRIADRIAEIRAGGSTNINDALYEATLYLGRVAHGRRHAVILVSDNQPSYRSNASADEVIRRALETETVIYSVKIGGFAPSPGVFTLASDALGARAVKKAILETGGEIIDAQGHGSVTSALAAVITRLKERYTLGYASTNKRRDGAFRKIDVRLADRLANSGRKYRVYARRGYYAPLEHPARRKPSE